MQIGRGLEYVVIWRDFASHSFHFFGRRVRTPEDAALAIVAFEDYWAFDGAAIARTVPWLAQAMEHPTARRTSGTGSEDWHPVSRKRLWRLVAGRSAGDLPLDRRDAPPDQVGQSHVQTERSSDQVEPMPGQAEQPADRTWNPPDRRVLTVSVVPATPPGPTDTNDSSPCRPDMDAVHIPEAPPQGADADEITEIILLTGRCGDEDDDDDVPTPCRGCGCLPEDECCGSDDPCCADAECCQDRCCQGSSCCGNPDPCCDGAGSFCCANPDRCCHPDNLCCGSPDSCCDPGDPCCGDPDPCCNPDNPCCNSPDLCCGSTDPCCGVTEPCCGPGDKCCGVDCDDGLDCTADTCDEETGECEHCCIPVRGNCTCPPPIFRIKSVTFEDGQPVNANANPGGWGAGAIFQPPD